MALKSTHHDMMEIIWESKDMLTAIYRRGDSFWLEHDGHMVCPATTYTFACWYAQTEFLAPGELTDRPFPAAA